MPEEVVEQLAERDWRRAAFVAALLGVTLVVAWRMIPLERKMAAARYLMTLRGKPCIGCDDEALGLTLPPEEIPIDASQDGAGFGRVEPPAGR